MNPRKTDSGGDMETQSLYDLVAGMEARNKEVWSGTFDGVDYEIQNFAFGKAGDPKDKWTFYLYIHLERIPEGADDWWLAPRYDDKNRTHYDYYESPLTGIEWHGGITWYSKETGADDKRRVIKAGCDFQHYWDEGHQYRVQDVKMEVIKAIQSFRRIVPGYRYWCPWNGQLHDPSQVKAQQSGRYSCECQSKP